VVSHLLHEIGSLQSQRCNVCVVLVILTKHRVNSQILPTDLACAD